MKNKWKKPELIVLVKSRPEENVLAFCKTGGASGTDAAKHHAGCMISVNAMGADEYKDCGGESGCYKCCDAPTS